MNSQESTNIDGGYILLPRQIIESLLWDKSALCLKVYLYLMMQAQHRQYKDLKRGQLFTSIEKIREAMSWHSGACKKTPSKDQIFQIIDWLRNNAAFSCRNRSVGNDAEDAKATSIATSKATHGILITLYDYCIFQDPKNYESNGASNAAKVTQATPETKIGQQYKQECFEECKKNDKKKERERTPPPCQAIIDLYHSICLSYSQVMELSEARKRTIRARWKEHPDLEYFRSIFEAIEGSSFLKGNNDRGWQATFDWIMKPTNIIKIAEGNYTNKVRVLNEPEMSVGMKSLQSYINSIDEEGIV